MPGIGPVTATCLAASVSDAKLFEGGREFAAWLGLVPRQHSTRGKPRLGSISKMGNRHLRKLLVVGAHAALYRMKKGIADTPPANWARCLLSKKPFKLVAVALANKIARIAWAFSDRRHKVSKRKYRITRWDTYSESPSQRGYLTVWVSGETPCMWLRRGRDRGAASFVLG